MGSTFPLSFAGWGGSPGHGDAGVCDEAFFGAGDGGDDPESFGEKGPGWI